MSKVTEIASIGNKVSIKDYDDMMRKLISSSEYEKTNLDHQILLRKNTLTAIQEQINRSQVDFEKWKKSESDKFDKIHISKENDIIARERALRVGEDEFANRMRDLHNREKCVANLIDEKNKLANERIEVEKLHRHSESLIKVAHDKLADADAKFHKSSMALKLIEEREKKLDSLEKNLSVREENTDIKLREIVSREKNLEEVKKIIDPKLAELKILEDNIKTKDRELTEKETLLNARLNEQSSILRGIEEREKKVRDRERAAVQRDEEITRKALLAGLREDK